MSRRRSRWGDALGTACTGTDPIRPSSRGELTSVLLENERTVLECTARYWVWSPTRDLIVLIDCLLEISKMPGCKPKRCLLLHRYKCSMYWCEKYVYCPNTHRVIQCERKFYSFPPLLACVWVTTLSPLLINGFRSEGRFPVNSCGS